MLKRLYFRFLLGVDSLEKATSRRSFIHLFLLCTILAAVFIYMTGYLGWIVGEDHKEFGWCFRERRVMSIMSALMLILIGVISATIYDIRKVIGKDSKLWFWLAVGFIYLALDDTFTIHEELDHFICYIFGWDRHGIADHIDDLIVAFYGVLGIFVLIKYFGESLLFLSAPGYFLFAAICSVLTVIFDLMGGEENGIMALIFSDISERSWALTILDIVEELCKIYAEVGFVAAFISVLRHARLNNKNPKDSGGVGNS